MNHQQASETLRENIDRLPSKRDRAFADDLLHSLGQYGSLTDKQWWWVKKLAERTLVQPKKLSETLAPMAAVIKLFEAGSSRLKYPKVRLITEEGRRLRLNLAGKKSSRPGTVNVADASERVDQNTGWRKWYGYINRDGVFHMSGQVKSPDIYKAVEVFAADPQQAALAYAQLTGQCCFCNQPLTDKRSIKQGYGPTCAKNFKLPWGEKA